MKSLTNIVININNYVEEVNTNQYIYPITEASINAILENHINTRYRNLWINNRSINISKGLIERII